MQIKRFAESLNMISMSVANLLDLILSISYGYEGCVCRQYTFLSRDFDQVLLLIEMIRVQRNVQDKNM